MTKKLGFTMAEILLSLTIIGVVAAITLPSLMANINERTWNTQRKALYARLSQAIAMMPQLNGYGTLTEDEAGNVTEDNAAEAFLTEGLSKVLKINNICDSEHLADCGVPATYTNLAGSTGLTWPNKLSALNGKFVNFSIVDGAGNGYSYSQIDTKAAAFETQNGESIALYYNPFCNAAVEGNVSYYRQSVMCANFVYDLNGNKGPNTVGKDIGFITALYSSDSSVVAPMPLSENLEPKSQTEAMKACTTFDAESRLPNKDELASIFYNKNFVGSYMVGGYWSSSLLSSGSSILAWNQNFDAGRCYSSARSYNNYVRCVKR